TQNSSKNLENSALVARGTQSNNNHQTKKNRPWCDHCRKLGHTKETCWHLHGKPAEWKPSRPQQNKEGRGYTAAAEEDTSGTISNPGPFSKEQLEALQKMFQQTLQSTGTTIGTASIAQKALNSGKRIGNAEVRAGLYLLSAEEIRRLPMKTACVVSNPSTKTDSVVMLWHYRLATKCIFLGYSPNQKGYKCYSPTTKKFYTSMDVTFFKNQPFYPKTAIQGENWSTDEFQFWETEISTTSPLSSSLPPQTDSTLSVPENNSLDVPSVTHLSQLHKTIKRKGVRSCTQHPISNHVSYGKLSQNFQAFITSLEDDQLPEGKRLVGCKWIFTVKHNPDGSINRFKARLVAKGFTQSYGIDYEETFAPVAKLNSIRVLLSVAVNLDWNLHQLDVKNAFLNGELEEEAYMKIPPSMETPENSGKVYDEEGIGNLKKLLAREFEIKDLGQLKYFLGMEVGRTKEGIVVTQRKYVLDLLQEIGMLGCKPVDTLMDPIGKIDKDNDSHPTDRDRYQRLVGKLIYLTHTRPDIGFAVSMSSGRGLYFKKTSSREVKVFTDADWAGSLTDRRSTTGYYSYVWGNLVTWRSKKQSVVARSNVEAEFRAIAHGICEEMWLQRILKELEIISNSTMTVLCDNKATISIAKNPVQHDRTKHVEIDRHFIKEKLEGGTIILMYIPSSRQTADILTKALPKATYENMKSKLGILDIYYPT
ncbi:Retrovirus-related Pol polyprotein from transposon RE1, partial [Vitis vinifera]